ncbi:MAG: PLP-dependent cysteine synthase family protein [Gammaproteobacteria bacterium]|nr:MAG: PLP-dependent cysteine synthase family protein [Gammaproteobacteria bacterium]
MPAPDRLWVAEAIRRIQADYQRSADTHLIRFDLPILSRHGIHLYFKDESTHPTGSLKHRLARSLFLYGLCNGLIGPDTPIIEASSGSTAISEAYFARLLGLRFIAVVPEHTAGEKLAQIAFYGGECHKVPATELYTAAEQLARDLNGHYMDQFTYAERATDWRGNNNIAESLFGQMKREPHPIPDWIVVSAGTGGTSATLGRYIHYRPDYLERTRLCVADPEHSVFETYYRTGDASLTLKASSRIEGIGRPRVEPSFQRAVIDRMMTIPDALSLAGIHWLHAHLGRRCGGSTGTNLAATLVLASEMIAAGQQGSLVTLICDPGERYLDTYYNPDWLAAQGLDLAPWGKRLKDFETHGRLAIAD